MPGPTTIAPQQLARLIGTPDAPTVIDVRLAEDFAADPRQLEAGIALYDALYRWARDGFDEGHDWPAGAP